MNKKYAIGMTLDPLKNQVIWKIQVAGGCAAWGLTVIIVDTVLLIWKTYSVEFLKDSSIIRFFILSELKC